MEARHNILVVDDEEVIRAGCRQILSKIDCQVQEAQDGETALRMIAQEKFDVLILDLKMPGISGIEVLTAVRRVSPETAIIVITGYATVDSAVEAMKAGAADFLPKPFTPDTLRIIVRRVLENKTLKVENLCLKEEARKGQSDAILIGESPAMEAIRRFIEQVGPTDSTVLITGESGTGKEVVARALHAKSLRRDKPFVAVDCSALVGTLLESELFGHVKGSFTGAIATKYGRFELANGGTIFFDEVGNLSPEVQAKFLRVLQEREFSRVGSTQVVRVDVRVLAATNKDLLQATKTGSFREDLYYRLSVLPITIPPLRQHKEDIPLLARYFLNKYNQKRKREIRGISPEAMDCLMAYDWPGNVRELENAIERAVVLSPTDILEAEMFSYLCKTISPTEKSVKPLTLATLEREHILRVLRETKGNKVRAAKLLGIDRKTLWRKLKQFEKNEKNQGI